MLAGTGALAEVLLVPRSSRSLAGHVAAEAAVLEASLVTRASRKDTGWLVWALSGIPMSGRLATSAAARTAALFPVAVAKAVDPRVRTESAMRARRNMVAH